MKTILTKLFPTTSTKPARIKATGPDGSSVIVTQGEIDNQTEIDSIYSEQAHRYAARKLADTLGDNWKMQFVSGETPQGYAHVFVDMRNTRETIQENLLVLLDGLPNEAQTAACQIIVDAFNDLTR